jgi:hypothetical protein
MTLRVSYGMLVCFVRFFIFFFLKEISEYNCWTYSWFLFIFPFAICHVTMIFHYILIQKRKRFVQINTLMPPNRLMWYDFPLSLIINHCVHERTPKGNLTKCLTRFILSCRYVSINNFNSKMNTVYLDV